MTGKMYHVRIQRLMAKDSLTSSKKGFEVDDVPS